jgi:hypothetical protein
VPRLFEFSDLPWLPSVWRELFTEVLQFQACAYRMYAPAIPLLRAALAESGRTEILDLCSGSGGPLPHLWTHLGAERITLTDRFPARRTVEEVRGVPGLAYSAEPVDARAVPPHGRALRTMFTSFHHFGPDDARRILGDAVAAGAPIAVFEFTERRVANYVRMVFSTIGVLFDSWRMRPRTWSRVLWTYLLPVVPLLYLWDGLVSHGRSYRPSDLRALTAPFSTFRWRIGTLASGSPRDRLTYVIGIPVPAPATARAPAA